MPLMATNLSGQQPVNARSHRVVRCNLRAIRPRQPKPRPALPARIGLRMETPVSRVVVLRLAGRAHLETRHRGLRPVVRNAPRDREPRPAVGAVQERIAIAPVGGIEQLAQTVGAGGRIRRNPRAHLPAHLAGHNPEPRLSLWRRLADRHRVDPRQRRSLRAQPRAKTPQSALPALRWRSPPHPCRCRSAPPGPPRRPAGTRTAETPLPAPRRAPALRAVGLRGVALRAVLVLVEILRQDGASHRPPA